MKKKKRKLRLRWDNIFKDCMGILAFVIFCWAVYVTAEPIDENKAEKFINEGVVEVAAITDDPVRDFLVYDAEQEDALKKLPRCSYCNEPIQDEELFDIEGTLYCEEHAKELFQRRVEGYVE